VEACWSEGKRLCTPAFRSETEGYALARLSRDGLVTVGPHRAPEPRHPAWVSEAEVDVMIVPGLAFDASGGRLGRGGGHYDRILRRVRATAFRMGLGFDFQVVAQVPMLERDMRLDAVITETRVIRTPDRLNERPGERSASCTS
jgi:5-formyltetrahydrofolate cyclo-ligase